MEKPNLKSVKDKEVLAYIEYLEKQTAILTTNSRAKTYVALRNQVNSWVEQLTIREAKMPHPEDPNKVIDVTLGYVDLFGNKDEKEFDRVWKFMEGADEMEDRLQKMYDKLLPQEKEDVDKIPLGSSVERHIFNKKD